MVERELDLASRSRAFDGYALLEDDDDDAATSTKLHTLDTSADEGVGVSAVALAGGSLAPVLAITYEHAEHPDWCDHATSLSVWHLNRRDFDPGAPHIKLDTFCCLTSLSFHPSDSSLLLGGGFTGEVFMWSLARNSTDGGGGVADMLLASSNMQGHTEKVNRNST
jgi:hypothetical protein